MDRTTVLTLLDQAEAHALTRVERRHVGAARARVASGGEPTPAGLTAVLKSFPAARAPLQSAVTVLLNSAPRSSGAAEDTAIQLAQARLQAAVAAFRQETMGPYDENDPKITAAQARVQQAQAALLAAQRAAQNADSYTPTALANYAVKSAQDGVNTYIVDPVRSGVNAYVVNPATQARDEVRRTAASLQTSLTQREQDWSEWFKDLMKDSATTVVIGGVALIGIGMLLWNRQSKGRKS